MSAPGEAIAGQRLVLVGSGFHANTSVKLVLEAARPVELGTVQTSKDGTFRTSVVMPSAAPGAHRIRVVGISISGSHLALAAKVRYNPGPGYAAASASSLATPVLLTLSVIVPLATWLALEVAGWRRRHNDRPPHQ